MTRNYVTTSEITNVCNNFLQIFNIFENSLKVSNNSQLSLVTRIEITELKRSLLKSCNNNRLSVKQVSKICNHIKHKLSSQLGDHDDPFSVGDQLPKFRTASLQLYDNIKTNILAYTKDNESDAEINQQIKNYITHLKKICND